MFRKYIVVELLNFMIVTEFERKEKTET